MAIDKETTRQVALSVGAVIVFIVALVAIGVTFGDNQGISTTGGLALVALIALFIIGMGGAGLWLARQDYDGS
jgi:hypothetical protein